MPPRHPLVLTPRGRRAQRRALHGSDAESSQAESASGRDEDPHEDRNDNNNINDGGDSSDQAGNGSVSERSGNGDGDDTGGSDGNSDDGNDDGDNNNTEEETTRRNRRQKVEWSPNLQCPPQNQSSPGH